MASAILNRGKILVPRTGSAKRKVVDYIYQIRNDMEIPEDTRKVVESLLDSPVTMVLKDGFKLERLGTRSAFDPEVGLLVGVAGHHELATLNKGIGQQHLTAGWNLANQFASKLLPRTN